MRGLTNMKRIDIEIIRHAETGMYLAFSEDMKGLYVHARTLAELNDRVPVAIRDIYEAAGQKIESIEPVFDAEPEHEGFEPTRRTFQMREAA